MKLAINITFAIIVILLFSLLVQEKSAGAASILEVEQVRLQAIIDNTDGIDAISKKLRAESETGRLLADYIALVQKFWDTPNLALPKDTPDDSILNYLALKMFSTVTNQGSKKTVRAYLLELHKLNKKIGWFKEDNFLINMTEYGYKMSEQRDYWWRAKIIKNLRYISTYDDEMHKVYFVWLNAAKGWVQKREIAFWQKKWGRNVCEGIKYESACISKLQIEFKKLQLKRQETSLMELVCDVKILRSGEIINIKWCEL